MFNYRYGMELSGRLPFYGAEKEIEYIKSCGYDFAEISLTAYPFIIEGSLNERMISFVKPILQNAGLQYTAHIGTGLDLRTANRPELHFQVLKTSIQLCSILGIDILTVHFEEASARQCIEKQFFDFYRKAAYYAGENGVVLCMENIETEDYRRAIELVDCINMPSMRMTLDLGHLFLAVHYFGGDYFAAIDEIAPYTEHVHIHDNTGTYEPMRLEDYAGYKLLSMNERIAFGQGDLHLPLFWGCLPTTESIKRLDRQGYTGKILLECGGYNAFYKIMLDELKQKLCCG